MIYVTLMGGLGNQMFQYAFGRALALRGGYELCLSLAFLEDPRHKALFAKRDYGLGAFAINAQTSARDPYYLFAPGILNKLEKRLVRGKRIREQGLGFDPQLTKPKDGFVYEGSFQNERYFAEARDTLLKELRPTAALSPSSEEIANRARVVQSVSIHIRRGDYVSDPRIARRFGVCGMDYYRNAIAELRGRINGLEFFVFSDEIPWTRTQFPSGPEWHFVEGDGQAAWEDLVIMSACRHNIVANSSFSWWGAWLGSNPDKTVIAPEPWFVGDMNTQDIVPPSWIKISAAFGAL